MAEAAADNVAKLSKLFMALRFFEESITVTWRTPKTFNHRRVQSEHEEGGGREGELLGKEHYAN